MYKKKNYNKILCEAGRSKSPTYKGRNRHYYDNHHDEDSFPDKERITSHIDWRGPQFRDHLKPLERLVRSLVGMKETEARAYVVAHSGNGFQRNHVLQHYDWFIFGYETEDGMLNTSFGQYHFGEGRWGIIYRNFFYIDKDGYLREYKTKTTKKKYPDNHTKKKSRKLNDSEGREEFINLINKIKKAS